MQGSHKFDFFNNSNHLKDLVIRILWTLVMSFSDAQAMILTVILSFGLYMSTHDSMASCMILLAVDLVVHLVGAWLSSSSWEM
jgi:hypothetical protein